MSRGARLLGFTLALVLALSLRAPASLAAETLTIPDAVQAVRGTPEDEALAARSIVEMTNADLSPEGDDIRQIGAARLVLLGDVGLRHAAEHLAAHDVGHTLRLELWQVVAQAEHEAVDALLAQAARSTRPDLRMISADGLGRGRTADAVSVLDLLARDPVPGVRAAALRALFALDDEAAIRIRRALPRDPRPDLATRRLAWHRLRDPISSELVPLAREAWRHGRTPDERIQGARLLTRHGFFVPLAELDGIVQELGTDALGAALTRIARGLPRGGYDALDARTAAIVAAWTARMHPAATEADRARLLNRLLGHLAAPVRGDAYEKRMTPETILRMLLPDLGAEIVEPTLARLAAGAFRDPKDGVDLLLEALPEDEAATALRRLLDRETAPDVPAHVRVQAAGGLRTLSRIGDEALARRLLAEDEEPRIRTDITNALASEPGPWVVPLLRDLLGVEGSPLGADVIRALEQREEPEARTLLVAHLFQAARQADARMKHLIDPGDAVAYDVLERALADPRTRLRECALQRAQRAPRLRTDRTRDLIRAYRPLARSPRARTHEYQQLLYAHFVFMPEEAIAYARAHWQEFITLKWEHVALRSLQNLRAPVTTSDLVDFVLELVAAPDTPPRMLREAATALEGVHGHRDADLDAFWARLLTHEDVSVVDAGLFTLDHPGRGDLTAHLAPLLANMDLADPEGIHRPEALLEVLAHQPVAPLREPLQRLALDTVQPSLRVAALRVFEDRLDDDSRALFLAWLASPPAGEHPVEVLRAMARLLGRSHSKIVAPTCAEAMRRVFDEAFSTPLSLDPEQAPPRSVHDHVGALALTIAHTGHEPTIVKILADQAFAPHFARHARRSFRLLGRTQGASDASSTARSAPPLDRLAHRNVEQYYGMTYEVIELVRNLKPVGDAVLARALRTVLEERRTPADLAAFPDPYLHHVAALLHDPPTGDLEEAAAVAEAWALRLAPRDGAVDYGVAQLQSEAAMRAGHFDAALAASTRARRILARRAYDDDLTTDWRRTRGQEMALEGAAAWARGDEDTARARFAAAVALNPTATGILTAVSRAQTRCGYDPEAARALADRAWVLERRALGDPTATTAAALGEAYLRLGNPRLAVRAFEARISQLEDQRSVGGRHHLRLARARALAGSTREALAALAVALDLEPTLEDEIRADEAFATFREDGRLEALIEAAREARRLPAH